MPLTSWTDAQVIAQLDGGSKWAGATITYAFPTSTTGLTSIFGETSTFSAFSETQKSAAILALSLWDDIIAPDLQLTTSSTSNIEFANSFEGTYSDYAAAYFPTGGTVWINNAFNGGGNNGLNSVGNSLTNPVIGRHGFTTFVHEIGHSFGLDHPGDYDGNVATPSNYRDSTVYSIMSYFGPSWGSGGAPNDVAWADWVGSDGVLYEPQTMMIDDVLAIQSIYGVETTTRSGDTVYGFSSTLANTQGGIYNFSQNLNPILCLFDSGGIDKLDVSGWNTQSIINLNAGAFSSGNTMTNNISIAYGVTIENATTGGGDDTLIGNSANNELSGGVGTDILNGGLGDDTLIGGAGADQLNGQGGSDTASYAASGAGVTVNVNLATAQASTGDASGDILTGISNVIGSIYADTLTGNSATNILNGGLGNDTLIGGAGADQLNGGGGTDTVSYVGSLTGITVNLGLATAQVSGGDASGDVLTAISHITGSAYNDSLIGNGLGNTLFGGAGVDSLSGFDGVDLIYGGEGEDNLQGGAGGDWLEGGAGADQVNGGEGSDAASYIASSAGVTVDLTTGMASGGEAQGDVLVSIERLFGSSTGKDILTGNSENNAIVGGGGDDKILGVEGNDHLNGGSGVDLLYGGGGADTLLGGTGGDWLEGGSGADILNGDSGSDAASYVSSFAGVTIDLQNNVVLGGDAQGDTLISIERIFGSNVASDQLTGNMELNVLVGGGGSDALNGMAGNDILIGGSGADTFVFSGVTIGNDAINDYQDGVDLLQFAGINGLNFAMLQFSGQGTTMVVIDGFQTGSLVTVNGAAAFTLDSSDFMFT